MFDEESNAVSENFEAEIPVFAVKLFVFHGRMLVMKGTSRNAIGLTQCMLKIGAASFSYTQIIPSHSIYSVQIENKTIGHDIRKAKEKKEAGKKEKIQSGK